MVLVVLRAYTGGERRCGSLTGVISGVGSGVGPPLSPTPEVTGQTREEAAMITRQKIREYAEVPKQALTLAIFGIALAALALVIALAGLSRGN
jgi:hypothetical protein